MNKPKYWRGFEELEQTPEFIASAGKEFPQDIPLDQALKTADKNPLSTDRRGFLKMLGFGMTAATLAACTKTPVRYAIPYVEKPDDQHPGIANFYASTTAAGLPILVKTRAGRPIKIEGNPDYTLTKGGTDAIAQASVLDLYDLDRLRNPRKGGADTQWAALDSEVAAKLTALKAAGGKVAIVSNTVTSPSAKAAIAAFATAFNGTHIQYDPISFSAILEANAAAFGKRAVPFYDFAKADVVVGFNADFLGTWLMPAEFSRAYSSRRDPKGSMNRHIQFEGVLSITGSMADRRFPMRPSQEGLILANLYNGIASRMGKPQLAGVQSFDIAGGMEVVIADLVAAAGKSLVVSGTNDVNIQLLVNGINAMLGNIGATIDLDNNITLKQGDDKQFAAFANDLNAGAYGAVFFVDCNPVYNTTQGATIAEALKGGKSFSVAFSAKEDETTSLCQYIAASSHSLESWGDAQQTSNRFSLVQPTVNTIFDTRQYEECLLKWAGINTPYYEYVKSYWTANVLKGASWDDTLRKGILELPAAAAASRSFGGDIQAAASAAASKSTSGLEVQFYEKAGIRDGRHANNPWLQEMPDPISRATWDDYLTIPVAYAKAQGLKQDDVVKVTVNGKSFKLPVYVLPGQANDVFGIAFGYGRTKGGRVAAKVGGANVFDINTGAGSAAITIEKTGEKYEIACVQTFHTLYDPEKFGIYDSMGIDLEQTDRTDEIIRETVYGAYKQDPYSGNEKRKHVKEHLYTLWESHYKDLDTNKYIRWVMAIDMNKCTGCGTCVVACQAENNVSVVGKKEVLTRREMHWMRIDRYFSGNPEDPTKVSVAFQPMLCQHCANASCETVCPVLATVHSAEGLNQMAYNRCVGTRYCANNCAYKVRRFNWFNYVNTDSFADINPAHESNELGRLVLNPDVTVRFRGVMEKCSFCVQRLQESKLKAKVAANSSFAKPEDGTAVTACQQACPTGAIMFGDLNDQDSVVAKAFRDERSYHVIEEVKTQPSIAYMTKVWNRTAAEQEAFATPFPGGDHKEHKHGETHA